MLNTLNCRRESNKIIFKILKEARLYISKISVLKASFLIDQKYNIDK